MNDQDAKQSKVISYVSSFDGLNQHLRESLTASQKQNVVQKRDPMLSASNQFFREIADTHIDRLQLLTGMRNKPIPPALRIML